ncbi:hypothetical protein SPI_06882 [Niveomyces insectorum RCEF 264]|uniref:Uncharacterized protein n=1 Tax=Niveomyces insectorum RCEF 264 TaxID=1081102 RepID=A0A167QV59_9HYPO|nr:hypothetical protein SPI_06882 [Niveomyces insectorum RCEF 264]
MSHQTGLTDEAVLEGHDLIDEAEHEAQADPKDFKKVHRVGEDAGRPSAKQSGNNTGSGSGSGGGGSVADKMQSKVEELKEKLNMKK